MRTLPVEPSAGLTTITIERPEVCHAMNDAAAGQSRSALADARPQPPKD